MTILDVFYINQGHQITDEIIYLQEGDIPIYTAKNKIKGYWNKSLISATSLPCLTYPTKANKGDIFLQTNLFDANNTAVLIPKKAYRKKIDLEWFIYKLRPIFLNVQTNKSGVSYLNKDIVKNIEIFLPSLKTQIKEREYLSKLESFKSDLTLVRNKIILLEQKQLEIIYKEYQGRNISTDDIFSIISGNSGLTEEYIYSQFENFKEEDDKYLLLTGSVTPIKNNILINKFVSPHKTRKIRTHQGECIHIVRKGKAGVTNYFNNGCYTLNDDAYILINQSSDYKIDLEWFYYTHKNLFVKYSTSSDNGTWSKTSFLKFATVDIPILSEQRKIKKIFNQLLIQKAKVIHILTEIENIFNKDLV